MIRVFYDGKCGLCRREIEHYTPRSSRIGVPCPDLPLGAGLTRNSAPILELRELYKTIAPPNLFEWVDITVNSAPLLALNVTLREGLETLHVRRGEGEIRQGVDAFLLMWENIPRFRWLSRVVRIKPFYQMAVFFYRKFARWHFSHMGYQKCDI